MTKATLATIGRNILAVALFLALYRIAAHSGKMTGVPVIESSLEVVAASLAVWLAFRLEALFGIAFTGTMAVFVAVEGLYHAIFGYQTVQTGPVHLAVMTAALVGLLLGFGAYPLIADLRNRQRRTSEDAEKSVAPAVQFSGTWQLLFAGGAGGKADSRGAGTARRAIFPHHSVRRAGPSALGTEGGIQQGDVRQRLREVADEISVRNRRLLR
jgi:hypothetical protein